MKTHIKDIRLRNNAGMNFPVCKADAKLLDMNATSWTLSNSGEVSFKDPRTCRNCIRAFSKRYKWALRRG